MAYQESVGMNNDCWFSPDRVYRYTLEHWITEQSSIYPGEDRRVMFIGLNPSTSDENKLDPTLRRLRQFTIDWGYDGFIMTNLFAFRSTDPYGLTFPEDPVGPDNDLALTSSAYDADLVVACWGNNGVFKKRGEYVENLLGDNNIPVHIFKLTKKGQPSHPLYLPKNLTPVPWV